MNEETTDLRRNASSAYQRQASLRRRLCTHLTGAAPRADCTVAR